MPPPFIIKLNTEQIDHLEDILHFYAEVQTDILKDSDIMTRDEKQEIRDSIRVAREILEMTDRM